MCTTQETSNQQQDNRRAILTILGCGTSTGVPIPGCHCEVCSSPDPRDHRTRTSALIRSPNDHCILIDASTDFRTQALDRSIPRIDAVLYTHTHADHILGTDDLRCYNFAQRSPIPCYGTAGTLDELRRMFQYIFSPDPTYEGGGLPDLTLHEIAHHTPLTLFDLELLPFLLHHGKTPVTGVRIGELVYATDCKTFSEQGAAIAKGCTHLVIDGLRRAPLHKTHMTIDEAIAFSEVLEARNTYLIHMDHSVLYSRDNPTLPKGVCFAYDGMEISFDPGCVGQELL